MSRVRTVGWVADQLLRCTSVGVTGTDCPGPEDVAALAMSWKDKDAALSRVRDGECKHDWVRRIVFGVGFAFITECRVCGRVNR